MYCLKISTHRASPRSTFPSSLPRKSVLDFRLFLSLISGPYLEMNRNTASYSHSLHCDKVDVTLNGKQGPHLFWSPVAFVVLHVSGQPKVSKTL